MMAGEDEDLVELTTMEFACFEYNGKHPCLNFRRIPSSSLALASSSSASVSSETGGSDSTSRVFRKAT